MDVQSCGRTLYLQPAQVAQVTLLFLSSMKIPIPANKLSWLLSHLYFQIDEM